MPLPRLFTQFPRLVAHSAIVSASAHLISLITSSLLFLLLFLYFLPFSSALFYLWFSSVFCLLVFAFLASILLSYLLLLPPVPLSTLRPPLLFVVFLLHPFLLLFSFPPSSPHFSSSVHLPDSHPSPGLCSPHSCRAMTAGMMGHNSPEPGPPRTCSH